MDESKPEIETRLNEIFKDIFNDSSMDIHPGMTAKDIPAWDSLMHITLIMAVQKEFKVRFNAGDIGKLQNVGQLIDMINTKILSRR
jgi:acyl carrier protein